MDQFIGEIRIFGGNYAPRGWAACDGQSMPVAQNSALFALLGTMYGGDGKTTFKLPELRERAPMHWGQGTGLMLHPTPGENGGLGTNTLDATNIPTHTHLAMGDSTNGGQQSPANNVWGTQPGRSPTNLYTNNAPNVGMSDQALVVAGEGHSHYNMQPYLTLMFIIALTGTYPVRG
jgi:microcystin-dependent protein